MYEKVIDTIPPTYIYKWVYIHWWPAHDALSHDAYEFGKIPILEFCKKIYIYIWHGSSDEIVWSNYTYGMDTASIVGDSEWTRSCPETEGWTSSEEIQEKVSVNYSHQPYANKDLQTDGQGQYIRIGSSMYCLAEAVCWRVQPHQNG